jgi:hypothetical protein
MSLKTLFLMGGIALFSLMLKTHAQELPASSASARTSVTSTIATSTYQSITSAPDFIITVNDISQAGFTGIEKLTPANGRFTEPVQYFKVEEQARSLQDCDDCSQILSVYITPTFATTSPAWISEQNPVITKIGERISYKWFVGFRILYIIGPREDLIRKLAKDLRERIVLNKVSH